MSTDGFSRTYGVELLCAATPTIVKSDLYAALRSRCPGARPLDGNPAAGLLAFVHEDHPIDLQDARIAAQTFIAVTDKTLDTSALEGVLQQSWSFRAAREAVAQARA